ncbi:autotransporter domain-containing protein [Methylophilaceae bacterium]|nr:autotransporter domain-containing protein [Methylophilaceae bacterium]
MNNYHLRSFVFVFLSSVVFSDLFANGLPVSSTDCQNGTVPSGGCIIDTTSQGLYGSNYALFGDISSGSSVGITIDAINGTTTTYSGDIVTTGNSAAGVYIRFGNTNSFTLNGNIDTSGTGAYGLYLLDSDNNTLTVNGNITTTGLYATSIYNGDASEGNNYLINGLVQRNDNFSDSAYALYNIGGIDNLTIASSAALKATVNDTLAYGIRNQDGATIASLTNAGSIQAVAANSQAYAISNYTTSGTRSVILALTNSGSIVATAGSTARAISNRTSLIESLINTGNISATVTGSTAVAISNHEGTIALLNNSGIISASAFDNAFGIDNYGDAGGTISTLINSGTITATATGDDYAYGIFNSTFSTINSFTNTGTIVTSTSGINAADVYNQGSISTFNNLQSGLSYEGVLPVSYNIIVGSVNNFGELDVNNASGSMTFGLYAGDADIGVSLTEGTYSSIITGVANNLITNESTAIAIVGDGVDSVGSASATLAETAPSSGIYDLSVTGNYTYFNQANTQAAINHTAYQLGSVAGQINNNMNFAHMTTYDCQVYGEQGGCLSIGGRYLDTSSPSGSSFGAVMVGGYKLNDQLRVGGFVDQSFRSRTQNIDLDMNTPMIGFNLVWNQDPAHLGVQLKLANTFQNLDADINRASIGASQAASGNTDIQAQSYLAELSYRYQLNKEILLQPLLALRYSRVKMDGYVEEDVSAPIRFASNRDRNGTLILGLKTFHQLTQKLNVNANIGYEKDISNHRDNLQGSISGMTSSFAGVDPALNIDKTRFFASLGAKYAIDNTQQLEATAYVQQNRYNHGEARVLYLNYSVGF